ncbi:hypothetical protein RQP46_007437 [Phenoliferia psychrophenolica]
MALAQITALIESIPTGVDPYTFIQAKLLVTSLPSAARTRFRTQLQVLSALLGLVTLCLGLGLVVQCARRTLWLFRLDRHQGAVLIVPHYTNTFAFFTFRFPTWSFLVSYISYSSSSKHSARWYNSASFLNAYGVGIPLALCLGVTVPAALSTRHYLKGLDAYHSLEALLATAAETYDGTITTFAVYAAIGLVALFTLLVSSFLHMTALRKAMKEIAPDTKESPTQQQISILGRIQAQYRTLRLVLVLFSITLVLFEAVIFFTMADTKHIIVDGAANQAASLFPLYTYTVFGLPISLILLRNSFNRERLTKPQHVKRPSDVPLVVPGTAKQASWDADLEAEKAADYSKAPFSAYQSYSPASR